MGEPTVFEAPRMNKVQKEMLENTPFVEFLGLESVDSDKGIAYQLSFREEHIGNTLLRTFHGGILASFGEITAALYLVQSLEDIDRNNDKTSASTNKARLGTNAPSKRGTEIIKGHTVT